ncbi:ADP-ribosylglycohydrolase family protein [Nocardiopsis metallicus]|uniref:ADP-ribosylglycohydrolase/catechol 2,3-dioxygenase-like lactoylglutathione lyase family enzyme n=1 Tax=Nocardiopsis metallicus TaxID=179819 RepID=A0A840WE50_9ACTN|nr:ADP-ribosylglycohydrolase family protein [Nocardiopsis metallicus]MBB5493693.1 ADP-ribosylglycohydrolase/catechol 2,3-dioxygenase-like lactoylglutathione lyase family enzyme [Nocardiopsis metallicus]
MTEPTQLDLTDRGRGLLLGAAAGDALGWPQEQRSGIVGGKSSRSTEPRWAFRAWDRWGGHRFSRYRDPVAAGEYSDDTQLLLATARACLRGEGWRSWLTSTELPVWPLYQRGGGLAVLRACRSWAKGRAPWEADAKTAHAYFAAGANGAAMRIAPHALLLAEDPSPRELVARVVLDGVTTHGHTRALLGAVVYALAVRHTLRLHPPLEYGGLVGELLKQTDWADPTVPHEVLPKTWLDAFHQHSDLDFHRSWESTAREMTDLLNTAQHSMQRAALADDEETMRALGCFDPKVNGAGTVTAAAACYLADRFSVKPRAGLLKPAFLADADTDTLASMTGGVLGAVHGTPWLTELSPALQDHAYIASLAERLCSAAGEGPPAAPAPAGPAASGGTWLESLADPEGPHDFADGRTVTAVERERLESSGKQEVERVRLVLGDGQHVMVDRREKPAHDRPAREAAATETREPLERAERRPPEPTAVVSRLALQVADLERTREFYAGILGARVSQNGPALYLSRWLAFLDSGGETPSLFGNSARITLASSDPEGVSRRVDESGVERLPAGPQDVPGSLRVRDPDGNEVLVWPASDAASSNQSGPHT